MTIKEFFEMDNHNHSTEFSKNIKDYRLLNEKMELDNEYTSSTDYAEYYDEYRNKGLYVVTADREIPSVDWYYWCGDLIIDKENNIIDGICFN
ncbi:hypothetical protein [Clostridium beijerinckii]|uniref:Uncharacterized protein n=1 Tax=Clostridium beijerinckii TaxID=1520 RepID=A0AAE5HBE4_CLOBE|nr:hypothetical protein [Clostridium beijerinckii]NSB17457.1 hypothetical protein [Clostridium beijerinckii]OOM28432.1 hypothetical protein CLOBE_26880 [Clostridium beijerinckii]